MSGKVTLTITAGAKKGETFAFEQHDTRLFGRAPDCQVCLEDNDMQISRHHFMLEVNPPDVRVRDLGSKHGTYINGRKYGGRARDEPPEEGRRHHHPDVDVHDGDEIRIGMTVMHLKVEAEAEAARQAIVDPVCCQRCGKNVTAEIGPARRGDYICDACLQGDDPGDLLLAIIQKAQAAVVVPGRLASTAHSSQERPDIEIPDYNIVRKLGVGGMGAVYLVCHKQNGSQAAMKIMLSKVAVSHADRERFKREISVTDKLHHQHVVQLLARGVARSIFYFVLEYCNGGSVDKLMDKRGGYLSVAEAGPIMLQALEGLAYIHAEGVVHRDLKPANILLNGTEGNWTAKVADMGLAKSFDQAGFSGMTVTGTIIGSFAFMPREQVIDFKRFEPVSDVWAMGATCYYMLTRNPPRDRKRNQDMLDWVLNNPVVPIRQRNPTIPVSVAEVIDRALATNIKERYQTALEMHSALAKALTKVQ